MPPPSPLPSVSPLPTLPPVPVSGGGGCGWFDFSCEVSHSITSWFSSLVTSAANPLFALLGRSLLSTPQVGDFATVRSLWEGSLAVTDTAYVLAVLAAGIMLMSNGMLAAYTAKDIAPRLVTGFAAANLSLLLAGKAIGAADGLSAALAGQGLNPSAAGTMMQTLTTRLMASGGIFLVLLGVFILILVLILAGIYVVRLMLTVVLIAVAPLALACHALPQTDGVARWWWRAFTGLLLIQSAQAIVLVAALRIFFTEQWYTLIDAATPGSAFDAIQLLALLYILARIPFWIGRRVWRTSGGSPVKTAARFAFGALVLRRISPALTGRSAAGALPAFQQRTTRTMTTSPSGASTVRVRTLHAQHAQVRKAGVTHGHTAATRTTTVQRFPAPDKKVQPRKPSAPRTTTVTTTTHSAAAGNANTAPPAPRDRQAPRPGGPVPPASPAAVPRPGPAPGQAPPAKPRPAKNPGPAARPQPGAKPASSGTDTRQQRQAKPRPPRPAHPPQSPPEPRGGSS